MNSVVTFSQDGNYLFSFGIQLKQDGTMEVNDEALTKALKESRMQRSNFSLVLTD